MLRHSIGAALGLGFGLALSVGTGLTQESKYDPGATDTTIKIGQTHIYSGPISASGIAGHVGVAYFKSINEKGGINGRTIELLSVDDGCTPPKGVEATRRLVEQDGVLAIMGSACTGTAVAVQKYLNDRKVPQLFLLGSAPTLHDHANFPWTIPFMFAYSVEGELFGSFIKEKYPTAKIGVLYQNDDVGKALLAGLNKGLGDAAGNVVSALSYNLGDPTVSSQLIELKNAGIDVFVNFAVQKYASSAIREAAELGWKPVQLLQNTQTGTGILQPAGPENAVGIISSAWLKQPSDPLWKDDAEVQAYLEFMKQYLPGENAENTLAVYGYVQAQLEALVIERAGNELTRENILKQATSIKDVHLPMMLPGVTINISPDNHYPIRQANMVTYNGTNWVPLK